MSTRMKIAGVTAVGTLAWAFVLLVISVPLALLLLALAVGLVWVLHRREARQRHSV